MAAFQSNEVVFPRYEVINISFPKCYSPTLLVISVALTQSMEKTMSFAIKRLHSRGQKLHSLSCTPFSSLCL